MPTFTLVCPITNTDQHHLKISKVKTFTYIFTQCMLPTYCIYTQYIFNISVWSQRSCPICCCPRRSVQQAVFNRQPSPISTLNSPGKLTQKVVTSMASLCLNFYPPLWVVLSSPWSYKSVCKSITRNKRGIGREGTEEDEVEEKKRETSLMAKLSFQGHHGIWVCVRRMGLGEMRKHVLCVIFSKAICF